MPLFFWFLTSLPQAFADVSLVTPQCLPRLWEKTPGHGLRYSIPCTACGSWLDQSAPKGPWCVGSLISISQNGFAMAKCHCCHPNKWVCVIIQEFTSRFCLVGVALMPAVSSRGTRFTDDVELHETAHGDVAHKAAQDLELWVVHQQGGPGDQEET